MKVLKNLCLICLLASYWNIVAAENVVIEGRKPMDNGFGPLNKEFIFVDKTIIEHDQESVESTADDRFSTETLSMPFLERGDKSEFKLVWGRRREGKIKHDRSMSGKSTFSNEFVDVVESRGQGTDVRCSEIQGLSSNQSSIRH